MKTARTKAWETRRARYGARGHAGTYSRPVLHCSRCNQMARLLCRLLNEGVLSEGQVSTATGMHRIEVRAMAEAVAPQQDMGTTTEGLDR